MEEQDYARIEAEIANDSSPVGIDAKKTHVMILAKLESIERRLDGIERAQRDPIPTETRAIADHAFGGLVDTYDDTVARLAQRGIDIDDRLHKAIRLLEKLTMPETMKAIECLTELTPIVPGAFAGAVDTFDDEVARLRSQGLDVDAVLRNGLAAILYLGQRISTNELEALGTLLRSDVLHPNAVDIVGRLGHALVAASEAPKGSVGPLGAFSHLGYPDTKRSTAFVLEFAKQFGAALQNDSDPSTSPTSTPKEIRS